MRIGHSLACALAFAASVSCYDARAAEVALNVRLQALKDLAEGVGAAGDALTKLTGGLRSLVGAGAEGFDVAKARVIYSRLKDTSALTSRLVVAQSAVVGGLEEYVRIAPTLDDAARRGAWLENVGKLQELLREVQSVLDRVREERSDFVLEPAYAKIMKTLGERVTLLSRLSALPPPREDAELTLVREIAAKYRVLIEQLESARDEMNAYLKAHPPK